MVWRYFVICDFPTNLTDQIIEKGCNSALCLFLDIISQVTDYGQLLEVIVLDLHPMSIVLDLHPMSR